MQRIRQSHADVVHGHGAKGGAYGRLSFGAPRALRAYTPHGGSLLFGHDTVAGKFYLGTERLLMLRGDLFLFESKYSAEIFRRKIGKPSGLIRIVHNGVSRSEFAPIDCRPDATDLVFMGELRQVKGIDVLIDAISLLHRKGRNVTLTLVGDGPDREQLEAQIARLGLSQSIAFTGAMPAHQALALGRIMVVPSRAESLPYVVLETAAAGKPLITTKVGGIPEIYGPLTDTLAPAENSGALAEAIVRVLDQPEVTAKVATELRDRVAGSFSVDVMVDGVLAAYREGLEILSKTGRR
jgi:glycosyltransferase involved in cell wall biosynthesis